jgi:hypothetical protein
LHCPDEQLLQWKEWSGARDAAFRDSTPGGWQLISGFLLSREVNPWNWLLLGWVGTLLVGSQVMKLIMEGIHLIYGDHEKYSFFGRGFVAYFYSLYRSWRGPWPSR